MSVMTMIRRAAVALSLLAAVLAVVAGCAKIRPLTAPTAQYGSADFGIYVAMGTSLTAGFQSGGLASRHQSNSYARLFADQAGTRFSGPTVNLGGWPPLLRVRSFQPLVLDSAGQRGAFVNPLTNPPALLDSAYNNMGIPAALLADVNDPTLNYSLALGRDVSFFYNIARQQGRAIPLTLLQLVRNKSPKFVSFEYGLAELLGPATRGSGTPAVPAGAWSGLLHLTLDSLDINLPNAKKAILNVFDVTKTPFFNTIPPVELSRAGTPVTSGGAPVFLLGVNPGDLVTLRAVDSLKIGVGYAVTDSSYMSGVAVAGTGRPLPGAFVLDLAERASIQTATDAYNSAIALEAARPGYALVDVHRMLEDFAASGVRFAGATYTTKYLTGGLFSVDGVHPTDLFHGLLANQMIDAVNRKFSARIPALNLSRVMTSSASSASRSRDPAPLVPTSSIPIERLAAPAAAR